MANYFEGKLKADGKKFAIVVSRFNSFLVEKLLEGALDAILRSGGAENDIDVFRVPGAFEIPLVAKKLAGAQKYDAVIVLGVVIRGATPGTKAGNKGAEVAVAAIEMANLMESLD